jgi:predicted nucleic acid-binding protein
MKLKQFVLDCSVTIAWFLEEEHSVHALSILEILQQQEAIVPAISSYEVSNVFCLAEKKSVLQNCKPISIKFS